MKKLSLKPIAIFAALQALLPVSYADSSKLYSKNTGHYYQRFDLSINASVSKSACIAKGGYLVTIPSSAEEKYIESSFLQNNSGYYFINGTDAGTPGKWRWTTGEKWSYQLWAKGGDNGDQPSNGTGEEFMLIGPNSPSSQIAWFDADNTAVQEGYICEWGGDKNVTDITVPDVDKNGAVESAKLRTMANGKHTVTLKDTRTAKLINTLVFATGKVAPQGFVAIKDVNNNRRPEIALLSIFNQQPAVFIKDAKAKTTDGFIKTIKFADKNYIPQAIAVLSRSNGADRITVLARHKSTKRSIAETRDSKTGKLVSKITF